MLKSTENLNQILINKLMQLIIQMTNSMNQPNRKKVKLTKQPLAKKSTKQSKEECLLDVAISVIKSKKVKVEEPEDIFRKTVAYSLKRLNGEHMKEYAKLKIQEVLFRCHSSQN